MIIQRRYRQYILRKHREKLKLIQMEEFNKQFFAPMKIEDVNEHKNEITKMLRAAEQPNPNFINFQSLLEEYYHRYRNWNENFPYFHYLREDNFHLLNQCTSLIKDMESIKVIK